MGNLQETFSPLILNYSLELLSCFVFSFIIKSDLIPRIAAAATQLYNSINFNNIADITRNEHTASITMRQIWYDRLKGSNLSINISQDCEQSRHR